MTPEEMTPEEFFQYCKEKAVENDRKLAVMLMNPNDPAGPVYYGYFSDNIEIVDSIPQQRQPAQIIFADGTTFCVFAGNALRVEYPGQSTSNTNAYISNGSDIYPSGPTIIMSYPVLLFSDGTPVVPGEEPEPEPEPPSKPYARVPDKDIYVINRQLNVVGVIDKYSSVIWTTRYYKSGDFELCVGATENMLSLLRENFFLVRDKDITEEEMHNVMIIKNIELKTDAEEGDTLIVTGKSISSIVGQRVVLSQTSLRGQVKECIYLVLLENIILPKLTERKIENLIYEETEGLTDYLEIQVTGDDLETFISEVCQRYSIGWEVFIRGKNFVFKLYKGTDRSYNQTENPYIVFSSDFDNLVNSDYQYITENFKNVAIVAGEGEGAERKKEIVGKASGLNRYETWVDARDISSNNGEINDSEYSRMLRERGNEDLSEFSNNELFDGEADTTTQYVLNRDVFLGDVVQIENDYGINASTRILEVIESEDASGEKVIPTFSTMEV